MQSILVKNKVIFSFKPVDLRLSVSSLCIYFSLMKAR